MVPKIGKASERTKELMYCEKFIPELLSTDIVFLTQNRKRRSFETMARYIYNMQFKNSAEQNKTPYIYLLSFTAKLYTSFSLVILLRGSRAFLKLPQSDFLPKYFSKSAVHWLLCQWSSFRPHLT